VIKNLVRYNLISLKNEGHVYRDKKGVKRRKLVRQINHPAARLILQSLKDFILLKLKVKAAFSKKKKSTTSNMFYGFYNNKY